MALTGCEWDDGLQFASTADLTPHGFGDGCDPARYFSVIIYATSQPPERRASLSGSDHATTEPEITDKTSIGRLSSDAHRSSRNIGGAMAAAILCVIHCRLVAMKQCVPAMIQRVPGLMRGTNIVLCLSMRSGLRVML